LRSKLPVPTPKLGATLEYVAKAVAERQGFPALHQALMRRRAGNVRRELEAILRELHVTLARNRRGLKLIDRVAPDHPDLVFCERNELPRRVQHRYPAGGADEGRERCGD
jgi:hypothetical protein